MFKKYLMVLTMLLALPTFASAWTVNAKTSPTTGLGTISSPGNTIYANGSPSAGYTVTPTGTNVITRVTIDGITQAPIGVNGVGPYVVPYTGKSYRYIVAYLAAPAAITYQITTAVTTAGGAVREDTFENLTKIPAGANRQIVVMPNPGYTIGTVTATGTYVAGPVLPDGSQVYTFSNIQANGSVSATFVKPVVHTVSAGADITVNLGSSTKPNLIGSATSNQGAITYAWTGAGLTFGQPASNVTTVTAAATGTFTATLSATDAAGTITDTATVTVTNTVDNSACAACHNDNTPAVMAAYEGSLHLTNPYHKVSCADCHTANTPHAALPTSATCTGCHAGPYVAHDGLYSTCTGCHDPHSAAVNPGIIDTLTKGPHKGGAPFHKAQYTSDASLPVSCTNCHGEPVDVSANQAILEQYAQSSHANPAGEAWLHFDWRSGSRSACARCHNGTAFVAKLGSENNTTNVFASSDAEKPGEVLNCSACHTDTASGAIRSADAQFTINMRNGATATYNVVGASALCARCHSGRETGASITADPSTTGVAVFVDSHYLPVAGTLYNNGGYEYAGQTYDSLGKHKSLGATGQGPCVTCHMPGKNHIFGSASCASCHNGTTAPVVNAATLMANYDIALNNLKLALAAKGIHYGPVHPFFFTAAYVAGSPNTAYTNWGTLYGAGAWKDTMGAAYNYNMLWSEKGAYAHNYGYAMKLIEDSTNFINNGSL